MTEATPPPVPADSAAPPQPVSAPVVAPLEAGPAAVEFSGRSRTTLLLAAAIIAGPLTLVNAVGFATVAYQLSERTQPQVTDGAAVRNRVSRFLTEFQEHDWDGAYGQLCKATRIRMTKSNFAKGANEQNLDGFRILRTDADALRGVETASVEAEISRRNPFEEAAGETVPVVLTLRLEGGQWRVCTGPF